MADTARNEHPKKRAARTRLRTPAKLAALADDALLEAVQRQTFRFFWETAHPICGMTRDRVMRSKAPEDDLIAIGGSGFGVLAMIVGVERGWVSRAAAAERLGRALDLLTRATCYHGAFPHFMNGRTGATLPFTRKDDGGDLVETSLLFMGLLCARAFFGRQTAQEARLRRIITDLWRDVEWNWYARDGRTALYWHWSPNNGWALNHAIRGWNECLITYVLAAASPSYAVDPVIYRRGFADGPDYQNGRSYFGIELPLGPPLGGPLYFAHYSFSGIDPRGLSDRFADYWRQNVNHVRINRAHCRANPFHHKGYGAACWGLTSSDDADGYAEHAPDHDSGTIAPTAALSSMPYAPRDALAAARHFLSTYGDRLWGRYGFVDGFCAGTNWFSDAFIAVNQGPIVAMIENHRTGLLWRLFMSDPDVKAGMRALKFTSPYLASTS